MISLGRPGSPVPVLPTLPASLKSRALIYTCWWGIATLTSVGYGDVSPKTSGGKVVGCLTALMGVLIIAVPLAIVAAKLHEVYEEHEQRQRMLAMQQRKRKEMEAAERVRAKSGNAVGLRLQYLVRR